MNNSILRPEVKLLRKNVFNFINGEIFESDIASPVLEIGPMQEKWTPIKEFFVDTRKFFTSKGIDYVACDTDSGSGCEIICDVLDINKHLAKESVGAIIALEVLEHVSEIWKIPEIFSSLLKKGGLLFISTPYYFYRHAPFPDYWRISEDGLRFLFSEKFDIKITPLVSADERKPLHYTLIGVRK